MLGSMKSGAEQTMAAVVHRLGDRLARAETDRIGALLELMSRHLERGRLASAAAVGLEAIEACPADPRRRCDALTAIARILLDAEAYDFAAEVAARAIEDGVVAADPVREARARELLGLLLIRRGLFQTARQEFRIAGMRHRAVLDTLSMKRAARRLGDCYRLQGTEEHARDREGPQ